MKLILGTAQFGMAYGVTNRLGQTSRDEVARILESAAAQGVTWLDTAIAYGNSEEVLGGTAASAGFRIVTKLPRLPSLLPGQVKAWVVEQIEASLARLRRDRLDILMLHHSADLTGPSGALLRETLLEQCQAGLVERLGASLYLPEELFGLGDYPEFSAVQLPLNVFDQRFLATALPWAQARNMEIHARSLFLQGTLLSAPDSLPGHFDPYREHFRRFHAWCAGRGWTPLQGALAFAKATAAVNGWVVGVTEVAQWEELATAWRQVLPGDADFKEWAVDDLNLILPSRWKKT